MPKQYVAMRNAFKKKGMSDKAAKAKAAAIYNSKHHDNPVGRYSEDFPGQATGASGEGNEQGVAGAATSSKPKKLKYPKRPEDAVKPVDTSMKEAFCKFMEDRSERRQDDAKHSGKYEKPRGEGSHRSLKTYPPDMKRVHAWAGDSRLKNSKHVRHGYRQSVKRDIAKDPENV